MSTTPKTDSSPASAPASASANEPAVTTYTAAQFTEAVERARTEERSKVAKELEELATLRTTVATNATEIETLRNTAETLQKSVKTDGKIDVQKLVEEVSERVGKAASNASAAKMTELEGKVLTLTTQLKTKELAEVRSKAIADAGGPEALIPELVQGNTAEEIQASVLRSKTIFDQTKAKIASTTTVPPAPGTEVKPGTAAAPAAPAAGAAVAPVVAAAPAANQVPPTPVTAPEGQNPTGIRPLTSRTDPVTWRAQRNDAMRQLEGRYASPAG